MATLRETSAAHEIITPARARGASRNGLIWVLATSMVLAIVLLVGYWLANARRFSGVAHPQSPGVSSSSLAVGQSLRSSANRTSITDPAPTRLDLRRRAEAGRL